MTPRPWLLAKGSGPAAGDGARAGVELGQPPSPPQCPALSQAGGGGEMDREGPWCCLREWGSTGVLEAMGTIDKWFPQQAGGRS